MTDTPATGPRGRRRPRGEILAQMRRTQEEIVRSARALDLDEYAVIARELEPPSDDQVDDFAAFVAEAHSWYKHLPLCPPGIPFRFFVNPFAGHDRIVTPDGKVSHRPRTDSTERFHYTWMTTADYRRRFASLDYEAKAGATFVLLGQDGSRVYEHDSPILFSADGQPFLVPAPVLAAGRVEITGVVHPLTSRSWFARRITGHPHSASWHWPEETGGDRVLALILARCEAIMAGAQSPERPDLPVGCDPVLEELMAPERQRLRQAMASAIRNMRALVYG